MLQNAYFLAKIGADKAENERNFAESLPRTPRSRGPSRGARRRRGGAAARAGPRAHRPSARRKPRNWQICNIIAKFLQNSVNFWKARSRLYQNEILQENMRLTAFFKLYKICILLHSCNLKIFSKTPLLKIRNFRGNSAKFLQMLQNAKSLPIFKIFS